MVLSLLLIVFSKQGWDNATRQTISSPLQIVSHCDADWGKDLDTRKSRYGSILTMNGSPIKISSGLQGTVHQATPHAELDAANAGGRDIIFARQFFNEIQITYD